MAVSLPKQWEDWCSWLLGLWLCISPWALLFDPCWRLLLRLGVATAEDIPELPRLLMQIGEHLTQFLRFGRHLWRQRHAERRGSLLQHLHERRPVFRRQLA